MRQQGRIVVGKREFQKAKKDHFHIIFDTCVTLVVISVAVAIGILIWQAYTWTNTEKWPAVRLFDLLSFLGLDLQNLYYPKPPSEFNTYAQLLLQLPATVMLPLITFVVSSVVALLTRSGR